MFDLHLITWIHTAISLVALILGFYVVYALSRASAVPSAEAWFIFLAVLTSATGYLIPFERILPSHIVGAVALIVLIFTIVAKYVQDLSGGWRTTYGIGIVTSVWLDAFVAVAQTFAKVPSLKAIAPTPDAPAFGVAQSILLLVFLGIGVSVVKGLRRIESERSKYTWARRPC